MMTNAKAVPGKGVAMENQMNAASMIQNLVRQGRITPQKGADLISARQDLVARQARKQRARSVTIFGAIMVFMFSLFGSRRN
ncbi:MAG: hypothetical protein ABI591_20885 [Kofleriaceae bacterium]